MSTDDLPDEDIKLFRESMRSVTPLKQKNKIQTSHRSKPHPTRRPQPKPEPAITQRYLSNYVADEVGSETRLTYHVQGLPKNRLIELRRGEIGLQGRLDLHGLTTPQAQSKLSQFITQHYQAGHRCVLVIHGKGSSNGEAPILKNLVHVWLKQLPEILAFHSALPKHGGNGALYVLLKAGKGS